MTLESWITLACAALAAGYFMRSGLASLRHGGACASGCGSCGSKVCPAKRLEALVKSRS